MLSLWWCSNKVLIACLYISSITVHSLCVWASLWLRGKPISSWKTNYWYRRSLLSIAGVFLCCWTSTEKLTRSSGKVSATLWISNWQETMLKTSQHLRIYSEKHFFEHTVQKCIMSISNLPVQCYLFYSKTALIR